jgi:hypothetical protein
MGQRTAEITLGLLILGFAGTVSAGERRQAAPAALRVLVVDQAHIRPEVLRAAEDDAAAIFASAGVQLTWLDQPSAAGQSFDVTVKMANGMKPWMLPHNVGDLSLGFAAVEPTGDGIRGRLVWVFCDQVEVHAQHHHMQISRLSGLVMAHEIGHLLLPAGHSEAGLMRATWELRAGLLEYFDQAQVQEIRGRLASRMR